MAIRGRKPGQPKKRPAGKPAGIRPELQRELGGKTAKLQLFVFDQMPRLSQEKKARLLRTLRERRVLHEKQGLEDLETLIARAVRLSADLGAGKKPKQGIEAVHQGILVTKVRAAFEAVNELMK